MSAETTINQQIADALGDGSGSYEQLIGRNVCEALGVEPTYRGRLSPAVSITPDAAGWLRSAADGPSPGSQHAAEIVAALGL